MHQATKAGELLCSMTLNHSSAATSLIMVLKKIIELFSQPGQHKRAPTSGKRIRGSWTFLPEGQRATSERVTSEDPDERRPATTPSADNHVRLCPHETLSFKRAQRVFSLYGQGDLHPYVFSESTIPHLDRVLSLKTCLCNF